MAERTRGPKDAPSAPSGRKVRTAGASHGSSPSVSTVAEPTSGVSTTPEPTPAVLPTQPAAAPPGAGTDPVARAGPATGQRGRVARPRPPEDDESRAADAALRQLWVDFKAEGTQPCVSG